MGGRDTTQSLARFFGAVNSAVDMQDGPNLATCLELGCGHPVGKGGWIDDAAAAAMASPDGVEALCSQYIKNQAFRDVVAAVLKSRDARSRGRHEDAFMSYTVGFNKFTDEVFRKCERENWFMPAMHAFARDLRLSAEAADKEAKEDVGGGATGKGQNKRKKGDEGKHHLRDAANVVQNAFRYATNDRTPITDSKSKKAGSLYLVCQMFKIYFRLNLLRQCKFCISAMDKYILDTDARCFDKADLITYRFYTGRLKLFEDQFDDAETHLDFCLKHCHKDAFHNKRRILTYLVPIKLYLGKLPTRALLDKYQLNEFKSIVAAVKSGDLKGFNSGLDDCQELFIRKGTFLLLEKVRTLVYRNLFKKIASIANTHQIRLSLLEQALRAMGMEDMELAEVECILANLIFRGIIKGYIAHKQQVLVLSKKGPFPTDRVVLT